MAREVIDLLSSPVAGISQLPRTINNPNPTINSASTLPARSLNYDTHNEKELEWQILSSDDELSLPKAAKAPKRSENAHPVASLKPQSGPSKPSRFPSAKTPIDDSGVYFHSDDFDTTVDLDASINIPQSSNTGLLGLNRKQMEEERLMRVEQKRLAQEANTSYKAPAIPPKSTFVPSPKRQSIPNKFTTLPSTETTPKKAAFDFSYLSDQSGTFDLGNDPFDFESPPAKKRRVSPRLSPKRSPSRMMSKVSGYQRSKSNVEGSTKPSAATAKPSLLRRASTASKVADFDPIVFTSSPDYIADAKRRKEKRKHDSSNMEDIVSGDNPAKKRKVPNELDLSSDDSLPDIQALAVKAAKKTSKAPLGALERYEAEKAAEKKRKGKGQDKSGKDQAKKVSKDAKGAEKERKRIEKEEKAREKQKAAELAQVNTLKTDKKISALEMIIQLPDSLDSKLASQVHTFLDVHTVEYQQYECSRPIIKWQRKVVTEYNEQLGYWDKVPPYIRDEQHILYVMTAKEFVDLATGEEGDELDLHVAQLKSQFESCKLMYIIEGLNSWKRKNKTTKERQFKNAVRSHAGPEEPSATQRSKKKKEADYVDEDIVEDALCKLHLLDTKVHQTEVMVVTAEWIVAFTLHISTIPYKTQLQSHDTAFCMDSGQVKTGDGAADTFVKMLQEILRITAPVAFGIAEEYPTVQGLIKGFSEHGPLALEDCRKSANRDGAITDRRVGPAISKRVYNVFMGKDPESWDV